MKQNKNKKLTLGRILAGLNTVDSKWLMLGAGILALVLVGLLIVAVMVSCEEAVPTGTNPVETTTELVQTETKPVDPTEDTTAPIEGTTPTGPVVTDKMLELADLYAKNPDVLGWVEIPGTKVNEVVMYTPNDNDKYLYKNFDGYFSPSGTVYMDEVCSWDPESYVLQFYGHNMMSGSRFGELMNYREKSYWKQHPYIYFTTLEEERVYEIIYASYDRVVGKDEEGFKFYRFVNPTSDAEFDEAMAHFEKNQAYDTGLTAHFGDRLLMLVTCAYHEDNGRFIVIGRELTEDEPKPPRN
jgi:sortase B